MHNTLAEIRHYGPVNLEHSHAHHQIILPIVGALALDVEGHAGTVDALSGAAIFGGKHHSFQAQGENRFLVMDLPDKAAYTDPVFDKLWRVMEKRIFFPLDRGLYHYTQFVVNELRHAQTHHDLTYAITRLLVELIVRHTRPNPQGESAKRLATALTYMDAHYHQPLSIEKLAALCFLSTSRFHALFRTHMGQTPKQYLTQLRIHKALQLLEESSLNLAQIAHAVGYGSQAAFTHVFRQHLSISPGRFRRAQQ